MRRTGLRVYHVHRLDLILFSFAYIFNYEIIDKNFYLQLLIAGYTRNWLYKLDKTFKTK